MLKPNNSTNSEHAQGITPELCNRVASPERTEMTVDTPTNHTYSITSTRNRPLLKIRPEFAPSVREKRKSMQQFTSRYLHETGTGGWDPEPAVLQAAIPQPLPTPTHPIFLVMQKSLS